MFEIQLRRKVDALMPYFLWMDVFLVMSVVCDHLQCHTIQDCNSRDFSFVYRIHVTQLRNSLHINTRSAETLLTCRNRHTNWTVPATTLDFSASSLRCALDSLATGIMAWLQNVVLYIILYERITHFHWRSKHPQLLSDLEASQVHDLNSGLMTFRQRR